MRKIRIAVALLAFVLAGTIDSSAGAAEAKYQIQSIKLGPNTHGGYLRLENGKKYTFKLGVCSKYKISESIVDKLFEAMKHERPASVQAINKSGKSCLGWVELHGS